MCTGIIVFIKACVFVYVLGCPMQDSQEFLRCLMDQLHEELKEAVPEPEDQNGSVVPMDEGLPEDSSSGSDSRSQSDNDFQSCDSCGSSERADSEAAGDPGTGTGTGTVEGRGPTDEPNEAEMLLPDEAQANRQWQKEKNLINDLYRAGSHTDLDKDVDTASEPTAIISSQGAIKSRSTGTCHKHNQSHPFPHTHNMNLLVSCAVLCVLLCCLPFQGQAHFLSLANF